MAKKVAKQLESIQVKKHQDVKAIEAYNILSSYDFVYIFGLPRIGKSLIALHTLSFFNKPFRIAVIAPKQTLDNWKQYEGYCKEHDLQVSCINYESIHKLNSKDYDIAIIDEAHNLGAYPKMSLRTKRVKLFCKGKKVIFLSGTPIIEGALKIYHQFKVLDDRINPFSGFVTFYQFFNYYGIPAPQHLSGRVFETYTQCRTKDVLDAIEKYFVYVNYEDANFTYQNYDNIVMIKSNANYEHTIKQVKTSRIYEDKLLDTASSLYMALHKIEGMYNTNKSMIKHHPKLSWLFNYLFDLKRKNPNCKIAIMAYFVQEQEFLVELVKDCKFNDVDVYSATKFSEGIDLSYYDEYVIYSFGYSGVKFVQLRDRIVNITKDKATYVTIPLIECSNKKLNFAQRVYEIVKQKKAFNLSLLNVDDI